jgi:DNA polymerase-3 subunit epsilon
MTRGQDTLVIDLAPAGGAEDSGPIDAAGLIVLAATPAELAAHEALLDGIARESKGVVVFRAAALAAVAAG